MFVLKHKQKDQFIYKGKHEVSLREIDDCSAYGSSAAARLSLNSRNMKFWLDHNFNEKPENFEVLPVRLTLSSKEPIRKRWYYYLPRHSQ